MEEQDLDFSWATYRDPDKEKDNITTFNKPEHVKHIPENVEKTVMKYEKKEVIKKKCRFSELKAKLITGLSLTTAALMVANIMHVNAKKLSANDEPENYDYTEFTKSIEGKFSNINKVEEETPIVNINEENIVEETKTPIKEELPQENVYNETSYYEANYEHFNKDNNYDIKELCINVPEEATKYLTEDVYNTVINNYGQWISKYSKMYGVDPNVVASLIMVESPDYDINNDYDYHQIGLGQYKGEYFDNETFKTYNYDDNVMDSYTVNVNNLYANPEEQIKMICITIATSASDYYYNLAAILEHHNKGCGSLGTCLDYLKGLHGYSSREEVLKYEDQNEIIKNMPKIGDPRYSYKIAYYINMCLEKDAFREEDTIEFKDHESDVDHITYFKINTMQRS